MSEYLEVIRLAMTHPELKFSYEGQFFQFADVKLRVRPAGEVPIWLAAGGPRMTEVAGRFADGVFVHMVDGEGTQRTREIAARAAREAGRDPDRLQVGNLIPTCVCEDGAVARRALRAYLLDYYFHLAPYHAMLAELGFEDTANALRAIGHRGDTKGKVEEILADPRTAAAADAIPDALLDEALVVGTPEECRARIREVAVDWGTELPILYVFPPHDDWAEGYRAAIASLAPDLSSTSTGIASAS
jgi:alkanesulfonate monooxygenase SsuD/methylene tetrahydromethanopterin reductase-like flavin-dependent oxidoreductase (luciferase family)